jgi:hypothetical protein
LREHCSSPTATGIREDAEEKGGPGGRKYYHRDTENTELPRNCHIVSPVDGVGLPSVPILNSVFSVSLW